MPRGLRPTAITLTISRGRRVSITTTVPFSPAGA
jgi:hypothetical protein